MGKLLIQRIVLLLETVYQENINNVVLPQRKISTDLTVIYPFEDGFAKMIGLSIQIGFRIGRKWALGSALEDRERKEVEAN